MEQIKSSSWYNQSGKRYRAGGIVVGKNVILVDQLVIDVMKDKGLDGQLVATFVGHNRHNGLTAYYYLLKNKINNDAVYRRQC